MKRFFIDAPRWLFLGILVFAPWAYGCTRQWAISALTQAMMVVALLWAAGCIARRMTPRVPWALGVSVLWLIFEGWWMIVNAQYYYDREAFKFVAITPLLSFAPGAVDIAEAVVVMGRLTGLLLIACFVADLSLREDWRRRIWWTVGLTGASIVIFGLIQRMLQAPMIFWGNDRTGETFFATYFYHGNAGAFINLVLPAITGLLVLSLRDREANARRAMWLPALLATVAAAFATASKIAMVVTVIILVVLGIWQFRAILTAWRRIPSVAVRMSSLVMVIAAVLVLAWFGWDRIQYRWAKEPWMANSYDSRKITYEVCLNMLPDTGLWGAGPSNFSIMFPHYTGEMGNKIEGFWRYAHEDYLQTIIEWGWIGAAVWAVPFFGAMIAGLLTYRRDTALSNEDRVLLFVILVSLGGVALHALVDFPLQIASLQLYVATFVGMAWASNRWSPPPARDRR